MSAEKNRASVRWIRRGVDGNRVSQTTTTSGGSDTTAYTYNDRNELLTSGPDSGDGAPDPATADTYTYYDDGSQKTVSHASTSTTDTFTYDLRGRLSTATVGGVDTTYAYDTEGNRVDETTFLVDSNNPTGYAQVLEQQDDTNLTYILGASVLGQIDSAGHAETFVTDGQGSTRMVLDDAGNIVTHFDYDAFGNIISSGANLGAKWFGMDTFVFQI